LLVVIAGRLAKNATLTGEILVNGKRKGLSYGAAVRRTRVLHFPHRSSLDLLAAELCV
jgi:hypothetical protein